MERPSGQAIQAFHAVIVVVASFFIFLTAGLLIGLFGMSKPALLVIELLLVIPAIGYVVFRGLPLRQVFRFTVLNAHQVFYSIVLAVSGFVLLDELDRIMAMIFPMPDIFVQAIESMMRIQTPSDAVFLVLAAVLAAGLSEEMLFRGLLQGSLERELDPARAIVLSAIAFSLLHLNPWNALQITVIGLLMGYLVWKSGSLWPAVFVHMLNNLFSLLILNCDPAILRWYSGDHHVRLHWVIIAVFCFVPAWLAFGRESQKTRGGT
ncbi:CPBP family intramembrane metalloprotease [candidate division KSB1 bacterium]|nr:CPBP family intramembrane metalloprotease [candidate division KSB1 bacterium]